MIGSRCDSTETCHMPPDADSTHSDSARPELPRIQVQVSLFALAKQLAGRESIELTLAAPARIATVRAAIAQQAPPLASLVSHSLFAIGTEYAGDDAEVRDGDQLALIPPVSGG
jgi:molybdopterin converting factor small subunit